MKLRNSISHSVAQAVAIGALLAPAPGVGQSYSPMVPPQTTSAHHWVYCYSIDSGQVVYNCPVGITTQYYQSTNAHFHGPDSGHPRSSIFCVNAFSNNCNPSNGLNISANTSTLGTVEIYTFGSLIGQAERLKAWPSSNPNAAAYLDYAVGYNDVFYNDHPEIWVKIGGSETGGNSNHGSTAYNRYMKLDPPYYNDGPAYKLYYASLDYLANHPEISRICTNDMALPFGGKFDICNQLGLPACPNMNFPWQSPHSAHDRGTAADVAGIGSTQCANAGGSGVDVAEFITRCVNRGALQAYSINEGNHAHCQFQDPNSFPH